MLGNSRLVPWVIVALIWELLRVADEGEVFLRVTFRGGRFDQHTVPVDVLAELATLQQAILALATKEFKRRNPTRRRRPAGFTRSARLYLSATEHNCLTAVVTRDAAPLLPNIDPVLVDVFAVARQQLFDVIERGPRPDDDQAMLKVVKRLGERLDAEESIELRVTTSDPPARVDLGSRERVARALQEPVEQVTELEGEVDRIDDSREQFALKLRNGRVVTVALDRAARGEVAEAFSQRPAVRLRVRGRVQWSEPPRVLDSAEIEVFDHERKGDVDKLWARIAFLGELPEGWHGGEGVAPSPDALTRARDVLARLLVEYPAIPRPKTFPTPEGGVQAEWTCGSVIADARFAHEGGAIVAEAVRTGTPEEWDGSFTAQEVTRDDVSMLAAWLQRVGVVRSETSP